MDKNEVIEDLSLLGEHVYTKVERIIMKGNKRKSTEISKQISTQKVYIVKKNI